MEGDNYMNEDFNYETPLNNEAPKPKRERKTAKLIASAILFGLIAGVTFQGVNTVAELYNTESKTASIGLIDGLNNKDTSNSKNQIETTKPVASISNSSTDVSPVVENTMPSIVQITSTISQTYNFFGQDYNQEGEGSGSGIIVAKTDKELLIATNNHVVADAKKIQVIFIDNKKVTAEVKGTDSAADLAVVTIPISKISKDTLSKIKVANLGDSNNVKVGEMAIAIGNALGYGQSVTVGYISAKDREVSVSENNTTNTMKLLQTDAAINPGNSGGALLNVKGEVIGINSVKYASNDVEGMGYAIPISKATPIIKELMTKEKLTEDQKGYLGISGFDVTEEYKQKFNMPIGIYISDVSKDGAAKEGGILKNDIIVKVNGEEIQTIAALQEKVNSYRVGSELKLTVMRNIDGAYKEKVITVKLKGKQTLNSLASGSTQGQNDNNSNPDSGDQQDPFSGLDPFNP
jgi:Trypsin-like serine proteases, typically periplasmic, contain C-terminal PDZ domain